ncbi:MAG: hypothetical protein HN948_03580 [Clostridia bacterium]|jgi:N-acetylneuraminate lyase|nr:hypothetical protein [Clostridia bacterium]MBT7122074.1 hypothetical protein [Clostridia bacterium]
MSNVKFTGIMPAIATPFDENQKLKEKTVSKMMDWHFDNGSAGFYICGAMGEGLALPKETRMRMAEVAVDNAKGKGVIIDHIGAANIGDTIELTKHATKTGADAVSSLPPSHFYAYDADEFVNYYKIIADNTDLPVIVYAKGSFAGMDLTDVLGKLMEIPNVIGAKYTLSDYYLFRKLKELNGGDINMLNGPDETLICGLMMGADGGIGGTYNIMSDKYCDIYNYFRAGDIEAAQQAQYAVNKVISVMLKYGVVRTGKAVLEMMGFDIGYPVAPQRPFNAEQMQQVKKEIIAAGLQI